MNSDCLHLIVEHLNFLDLLSLVQTNQELAIIACNQFRRRFSQKEIQILNLETRKRNRRPQAIYDVGNMQGQLVEMLENFGIRMQEKRNAQDVAVVSDHVYIYDFDLALDILKYFGSFIQKLSIKHHIESARKWEILSTSINKFCTESLIQVDLGAVNQNSLQKFTAAFENVKDFTVQVANNEINTRKLNETFPRLQRFSIKMTSNADYSFIDCELPHLEHVFFSTVTVDSDWYSRYMANQPIDLRSNEAAIKKLLQKNPQIRSIDLNNFSIGFIRNLKQLMPNLKSLALSSLDLHEEIIHFEKVTEFSLKKVVPFSPAQITFANLQTLRMFYNDNYFARWREFIRANKNVTRLEIDIDNINLPTTQLAVLTAELPHLIEMTLKNAFIVTVEAIIQLARDNVQLETFTYICSETNESALRESLQDEWKISKENEGVLTIFTFKKRSSMELYERKWKI